MRKRLRAKDNPKLSYSVGGALALLLLLALASFGMAFAQSEPVPSGTGKEARPILIERSRFVDGRRDPRLRLEFLFAEPRENCTAWRVETSVQSNGHAVFELKEPGDKKVVLNSDFSERHLELVLGDADCNYRIRIERNK